MDYHDFNPLMGTERKDQFATEAQQTILVCDD
ncbi:hypothetical protein SBBP2_240004 [Burkholderiales bacterium]|nr:hypothetical protein SBBP2_240004 [Burkholderiales bacterium]